MRARITLAVGALVASLYSAARAQDLGAASGSLRAGAWSSTRTLDDEQGAGTLALWMKAAPRLSSRAFAYAEGWVGYRDVARMKATSGLLREGFLDLDLGPLAIRAGKQILVWGRADAVNPTDNLSPRDYTLLVPDDDDQRFGTAAVKVSASVGSLTMTAVWLPVFDPYVVPIPPLPPPLVAREESPARADALREGALRLEQSGRLIDWSLSYFDGFDRVPNLDLDASSPSSPQIVAHHPRIRVMGADFAAVVGRVGLRGEAAYTLTKDTNGDDPAIRNSFLWAVLGADRTFSEYLNVNVQYVLRAITRWHDPGQIADPMRREVAVQAALVTSQWDEVQHGATLRISDKWFNETLAAELLGVLYGPTLNYAVRAKISYAITDRVRVLGGFDWFDGADPSPLRVLRRNATGYAEGRLSF